MVTLQLNTLALILGVGAPLVTLLIWLFNISSRFKRLEEHDKEDHELHCVMIQAMIGVLDGLKQKGCAGDVIDSYNQLKKYLAQK